MLWIPNMNAKLLHVTMEDCKTPFTDSKMDNKLKGKSTQFFLFHHWVRIGQTKTSFNRQFSPKRPEVGQIFILRSNFDQNKDHMTSKQVRGPSKNWHPASEGTLKTDIQQVRGPSKLTSGKWGDPQNWHCASEGTLKTDIQQVRGPSSNNRVFFFTQTPVRNTRTPAWKGVQNYRVFFLFQTFKLTPQ